MVSRPLTSPNDTIIRTDFIRELLSSDGCSAERPPSDWARSLPGYAEPPAPSPVATFDVGPEQEQGPFRLVTGVTIVEKPGGSEERSSIVDARRLAAE